MDWFGNRKEESFEYRRVDRSDWSEGAAWPQVTGGTIELSALSDLKASGSLSFEGEAMPDERGVVRVYYSFADQHGERGEFALATLLFSCAEPSYDGAAVAGTLECSSVLRILQSKRSRFPCTVAAGTQAVQLAIGLVEGCGLRVNSPEATAYEVREDYTFDAGKTYLEIVNGLLDMAGFSACWPDAYGVVQMERRSEPGERPVAMEFADDERSIMHPEVVPRKDFDVCNVFAASYANDRESLWASTSVTDPSAWFSTANMDEATDFRRASVLEGETVEARLESLKEETRQRAVDNMAKVEHVKMAHPWVPIAPGDAVSVDYRAAGIGWGGCVTSMRIDLSPECRCDTELRRFVRSELKTETEGGILWHDET